MRIALVSAFAAFVLPLANAADPPNMREGLWSVHTQSIDNPGNRKSEGTYTLCRSHAFDQSVRARAQDAKGCTKVSESYQTGKLSSELHCLVAGTVVETKGTTTFQGDSSFHSESHATYTPAMAGISDTTMIMDQKYIGACPAGVQPGDRTNADGRVIHLWKH